MALARFYDIPQPRVREQVLEQVLEQANSLFQGSEPPNALRLSFDAPVRDEPKSMVFSMASMLAPLSSANATLTPFDLKDGSSRNLGGPSSLASTLSNSSSRVLSTEQKSSAIFLAADSPRDPLHFRRKSDFVAGAYRERSKVPSDFEEVDSDDSPELSHASDDGDDVDGFYFPLDHVPAPPLPPPVRSTNAHANVSFVPLLSLSPPCSPFQGLDISGQIDSFSLNDASDEESRSGTLGNHNQEASRQLPLPTAPPSVSIIGMLRALSLPSDDMASQEVKEEKEQPGTTKPAAHGGRAFLRIRGSKRNAAISLHRTRLTIPIVGLGSEENQPAVDLQETKRPRKFQKFQRHLRGKANEEEERRNVEDGEEEHG